MISKVMLNLFEEFYGLALKFLDDKTKTSYSQRGGVFVSLFRVSSTPYHFIIHIFLGTSLSSVLRIRC